MLGHSPCFAHFRLLLRHLLPKSLPLRERQLGSLNPLWLERPAIASQIKLGLAADTRVIALESCSRAFASSPSGHRARNPAA